MSIASAQYLDSGLQFPGSRSELRQPMRIPARQSEESLISGSGFYSAAQVVELWINVASFYDRRDPQPSCRTQGQFGFPSILLFLSSSGCLFGFNHSFDLVLWKSTTQLGCAVVTSLPCSILTLLMAILNTMSATESLWQRYWRVAVSPRDTHCQCRLIVWPNFYSTKTSRPSFPSTSYSNNTQSLGLSLHLFIGFAQLRSEIRDHNVYISIIPLLML